MPQIIDLETSLNEDIENIKKCCKTLGELYKYFIEGAQQYDISDTELKSKFIAIIQVNQKFIDNSQSPEEREHYKGFNYWITQAYNILTDSHLRKIYDEQFLKQLYEQEKQTFQQLQNQRLLEIFKVGALFFLYPPIDLISHQFSRFDSKPTLTSIVKSIFKDGGITSIVRPQIFETVFSALYLVVDELAFGGIVNTKWSERPLKAVAATSVYSLLTYPLKFLSNVICFAPFSMSVIQIIKKIILREDQGNALQFKNLFHAFVPSLLLYGTNKLLRISQKEIERKIQEKEKENPHSKLYKNLSLLLCNNMTRTLISTALNWPLFMLRYQYPYEFVQSYLSGSPIPMVVNPISMAIKVYKQYGLKKFYTGALSMGLAISFANVCVNPNSSSPWIIFDN
ncbi:hypothetical protein ACTFIV_008379 [Dictyostelium citrinum]